MLDPVAEASAHLRAFLRIGGLSVARQQVALALQLGCERIVCIAAGPSAEMVEIQQLIEARGAQFQLIRQARALVGMVSAVDEVVVLADGLFASTSAAIPLLEEGQAVSIQPIEQGLAAGFERIDLNYAFGGAMRLPGRLVERLAELPAECDATSALLRIALQAGVRQKPIPQADQTRLFWTLVRSEDEAHALEPLWIRQRTRGEGAPSLARSVALLAVRGFGPALLHAGSGSSMLFVAAMVLSLLGFGSGWLGIAALGLGFAAIGWIVLEAAEMLARIESEQDAPRRRLEVRSVYGSVLDVLIVMLTTWGSVWERGLGLGEGLFPAFVLVALLRILPRLLSDHWTGWFNDRALLALLMAGAMLAGMAREAVLLGATALALGGIILPFGQSRLTRH